MTFSRAACPVLIASLIMFCERAPDLDAPKRYAKHGLAFSYPGNWEVTTDTNEGPATSSVRTTIVETPGDSLLILISYRPSRPIHGLKFQMKAYVDGLASDVGKTLTVGKVKLARVKVLKSRLLKGRTSRGEVPGLEQDFTMRVLGEKVKFRVRMFIARSPGMTVQIIQQAESADWKKVQPGFNFVLRDLKY